MDTEYDNLLNKLNLYNNSHNRGAINIIDIEDPNIFYSYLYHFNILTRKRLILSWELHRLYKNKEYKECINILLKDRFKYPRINNNIGLL